MEFEEARIVARCLSNCMGYVQSPLDLYVSTNSPNIIYFWNQVIQRLTDDIHFNNTIISCYGESAPPYFYKVAIKQVQNIPYKLFTIDHTPY